MPKYLIRSPRFRALTDGDSTPLGPVEISQEGNEWTLVDIDKSEDEALIDVENALANGEIDDYRPESILTIQGVLHPKQAPKKRFGIIGPALTAANRMGLDFPTSGITSGWQEFVQRTDTRIVAVCDTGRVPEAARAAHGPNVEIVHVHGGNDTHGHSTACVFRIVGTRGPLNKKRIIVTAQALPRAGGAGTTADIVNAIRAARNWRGPNGAKVNVISLSLGMDGRDPIIDREIIDTQAQGVMCVAAMGNSGWGIRATGTPAAVCMFAAGATTFDGSMPASFSSGGCNLPEETGAGPGQNVGLAHLDGGYGDGDGTSFSCPVMAAQVAGALEIGWTPSQIKDYLRSHQRPFSAPKRVGLIYLNAVDFDSDTGDGGNGVDINDKLDEMIWRMQEMDARIAMAQQARAAIERGEMSWEQLYTQELGPGRDLMREAIEIAKSGKV